MLRTLQRAPIRQKLMLIAVLTTAGTLLLAGTAIIYFNMVRFKEEMKRDLTSLADIVAQNSTAAVSFQDSAAEMDTLSSLKARPAIEAAAVYDRQQRLFLALAPGGGKKARVPPRPGPDVPR